MKVIQTIQTTSRTPEGVPTDSPAEIVVSTDDLAVAMSAMIDFMVDARSQDRFFDILSVRVVF